MPDAGDIEGALSRLAEGAAKPTPAAAPEPGIAGAVLQFASAGEALPARRLYRTREVSVVLGVFASAMLALDSEGLVTWANRMEVGSGQSAWLAALVPWGRACDAVRLSTPRAALVAGGDRLARALGGGEDPLFAMGWGSRDAVPAPASRRDLPRPEPRFPGSRGAPVGHVSAGASDESNLAAATAADADADVIVATVAAAGGNATVTPPEAVAASDADAVSARTRPSAGAAESASAANAADAAKAGSAAANAPVDGAEPAVRPTTLLLVGDSLLAGGLSAAITRALARDLRFRVVPAVQAATGLSRPDVFDWMKVVTPLIEREKPAFVVCSFGANDTQSIRQGDELLEFGQADWRAAYRERVLSMMRALSANGARVLWLGLPPMRDRRYSEHARELDRVFLTSSRAVTGVEYLELGMLVSGTDGDFATFAQTRDGHFVKLRMDDGVHYSAAGSGAIARWVVDWVYERYARTRAARR